jgi:lipoprotein-anchoring transpeptidase ErfK/SrfK
MVFPRNTRRLRAVVTAVAIVLLPAALAGCLTTDAAEFADDRRPATPIDPAVIAMYGSEQDGPVLIPAVDVRRVDPEYFRQTVPVPAGIPDQPGTVAVDPQRKFLYLVVGDNQAIRYGIGVGREGFAWSGTASVKSKQEWPKWFPPSDMLARDPRTAPWANGMPGGLDNPLGARALYLWQGNKDTLYRIHGTNEPWSIGHAVSSGCIRMFNQDVVDLYNRVPEGTKVIVLPAQPGTT